MPPPVTLKPSPGRAEPAGRSRLGQGPRVRPDYGSQGVFSWYNPGVENDPLLEEAVPVVAAGLSWHLGWSMDLPSERGGGVRRVLASAHDDTGAVVRQWDLGDGTVLAAAPVDTNTRLAVGVQRPPEPPWMEDAPVEVLALHPLGDWVRAPVRSGAVVHSPSPTSAATDSPTGSSTCH